MRQKEQKEAFLEWIRKEWIESNSDERFGQFLINRGIIVDNPRDWAVEINEYPFPFEDRRNLVYWGTYTGNISLKDEEGFYCVSIPDYKYKPISELETDHILAILKTQTQISNELRELFEIELSWRMSNGLD